MTNLILNTLLSAGDDKTIVRLLWFHRPSDIAYTIDVTRSSRFIVAKTTVTNLESQLRLGTVKPVEPLATFGTAKETLRSTEKRRRYGK